jgi:sugar/nucleoside kinase (ribokinase family)
MPLFTISGCGCSLADHVYNNVSFGSQAFKKHESKTPGDGGLKPGALVFTEELEEKTGQGFSTILKELTGGRPPDAFNIGGPSVVPLIHAAQVLGKKQARVNYYGAMGDDTTAGKLMNILRKTPLNIDHYKHLKGEITPFTDVFSDPSYNNGKGERVFVNNIGAAWHYGPEDLEESFFQSRICVFGGTALVPHIHDHIVPLLKKCKNKGAKTIINTVYDFRNEKKDPEKRWPLGETDESYRLCDLLVMDHEEAVRMSGMKNMEEALRFFIDKKVSALLITRGHEPVTLYSNGDYFRTQPVQRMPVSDQVVRELAGETRRKGDTTGCGDNFAGGVIASLAEQMMHGEAKPSLREACAKGIVAGGFACFYMGGAYLESHQNEKRDKISPYYQAYLKEIGEN